jgi:hypothetical protein
MKVLLEKFNLINKFIAYGKDERDNWNSLTTTFIFVVSCELLQLLQPFVGFCFSHVMFKGMSICHDEVKVGVGKKEVSLKDAQVAFQKTIT